MNFGIGDEENELENDFNANNKLDNKQLAFNEELEKHFNELILAQEKNDFYLLAHAARSIKLCIQNNKSAELEEYLFEKYNIMGRLFDMLVIPSVDIQPIAMDIQNDVTNALVFIFERISVNDIVSFLDSFGFKDKVIDLFNMQTCKYVNFAVKLISQIIKQYKTPNVYEYVQSIITLGNLMTLYQTVKENTDDKKIVADLDRSINVLLYCISTYALPQEAAVDVMVYSIQLIHVNLENQYSWSPSEDILFWTLKNILTQYPDLIVERLKTNPLFVNYIYYILKKAPYGQLRLAACAFLRALFNADSSFLDPPQILEILQFEFIRRDQKSIIEILNIINATMLVFQYNNDFIDNLIQLLRYDEFWLISKNLELIFNIIINQELELGFIMERIQLFRLLSDYGESDISMDPMLQAVEKVFKLALNAGLLPDVCQAFNSFDLSDIFDEKADSSESEEVKARIEKLKEYFE